MASSTISLSGNINELAKITLDTVTNTSGAYSHTTTVSGITPDHKVLSIECGDQSVFRAPITISTATNAITLSCDSVVGTSTVIVYVQMTGDNVPITSLEYSALSTRVGNLSDLETSDKSSVVNSINSLNENIITNMLTTSTTPVIVGYAGSTPIYSVCLTYNSTMARDTDIECGNIGTNHTVLAVMGCVKVSSSANNVYTYFPLGPFFGTSYNYSNGKVYVRQIITTNSYNFACKVNYIYT